MASPIKWNESFENYIPPLLGNGYKTSTFSAHCKTQASADRQCEDSDVTLPLKDVKCIFLLDLTDTNNKCSIKKQSWFCTKIICREGTWIKSYSLNVALELKHLSLPSTLNKLDSFEGIDQFVHRSLVIRTQGKRRFL